MLLILCRGDACVAFCCDLALQAISPLCESQLIQHIVHMPQAFTARENTPLAEPDRKPRKVLVTGAAGNIGSYFAEHSRKRYDLRLMIRASDESEDAAIVKNLGKWGE